MSVDLSFIFDHLSVYNIQYSYQTIGLGVYSIFIHKNTTTYDVGNLGPGLGQAHKCGGVKPVNGIPALPS
jgi:hypothetical protein